MSPRDLSYHGRSLTAEPTNLALADVARSLDRGETVGVVLEPGDATRYLLVITPAWAPPVLDAVGPIGVYGTAVHDTLVVTRLVSENDARAAVVDHELWEDALAAALGGGNAWTGRFLRWWFDVLWAALDREGERR